MRQVTTTTTMVVAVIVVRELTMPTVATLLPRSCGFVVGGGCGGTWMPRGERPSSMSASGEKGERATERGLGACKVGDMASWIFTTSAWVRRR